MGAAVPKQSNSRSLRVALAALCMALNAAWTLGLATASPAASTTKGAGGAAAPGATAPRATAPSVPPHGTAPAGKITITSMACVPSVHCSTDPRRVSVRGLLLVKGKGLKRGMVVAFPHSIGARIARNSPTAHLANSTLGLIVHVPSKAHSGRLMVLLSHGLHSNSYGPIHVVNYALRPPAPPAAPSTVAAAPSGTAFDGQGMWIWYVSQSDGGDLASIVAQAHTAGVTTLYVKSSDGSSNYWSQFSPELVQTLHANGLKVCAWQYVYGTNPAGEANLGAEAAANGADCLVIDAEAEYEGKYGAAQTYIADLRAKIGAAYPLGLASFPYVYYHTSFPYSVFLGPEGAQFNAPQMYWKDIGDSVDTTYANTFISNRVYGRPIFPLGQTYSKPSTEEVVRFREEAPLYGAGGISFWDFQETPGSLWTALATPLGTLTTVTPNQAWSELGEGSKGDPVLWMQEHSGRRDSHSGDDRHLRRHDQGKPRAVPDCARHSRQRPHRSGHVAGPVGPGAGRSQLDRRRTKGLIRRVG